MCVTLHTKFALEPRLAHSLLFYMLDYAILSLLSIPVRGTHSWSYIYLHTLYVPGVPILRSPRYRTVPKTLLTC